jgi:hypothetical protein
MSSWRGAELSNVCIFVAWYLVHKGLGPISTLTQVMVFYYHRSQADKGSTVKEAINFSQISNSKDTFGSLIMEMKNEIQDHAASHHFTLKMEAAWPSETLVSYTAYTASQPRRPYDLN